MIFSMDDIERKVRLWDDHVSTIPTFEEIRDVEFVRRSGTINMVTENVQRELYRRGRYAGVLWLERCKHHGTSWTSHYARAVGHYTAQHGPPDTWFPRELLDTWEEAEIESEARELRARLEALESRRSAKSPRMVVD